MSRSDIWSKAGVIIAGAGLAVTVSVLGFGALWWAISAKIDTSVGVLMVNQVRIETELKGIRTDFAAIAGTVNAVQQEQMRRTKFFPLKGK